MKLLGEGLVIGQLEAAPAVRRQAVIMPDLHDRRRRDANRFGHCTDSPMRRLMGGLLQRQRHDLVDQRGCQRRDTGRPGLVAQQAIDTLRHEPLLPAPYASLRLARGRHDRGGAQAIVSKQDNPRSPHVLLRRSTRCDDRFKPSPVRGRYDDADISAHPASSHNTATHGIPKTDSSVLINPLARRHSGKIPANCPFRPPTPTLLPALVIALLCYQVRSCRIVRDLLDVAASEITPPSARISVPVMYDAGSALATSTFQNVTRILECVKEKSR